MIWIGWFLFFQLGELSFSYSQIISPALRFYVFTYKTPRNVRTHEVEIWHAEKIPIYLIILFKIAFAFRYPD